MHRYVGQGPDFRLDILPFSPQFGGDAAASQAAARELHVLTHRGVAFIAGGDWSRDRSQDQSHPAATSDKLV